MNFPLSTAFTLSHRFWVVVCSFSFVSKTFLISSLISLLTHTLFNSKLFTLHKFEWFWVFAWRLVSSFKPLWSEKILDMISIFWYLLRLILCPTMWSIFENAPCAFEKSVYFASLGWKSLYISMKSIHASMLFSATISLLILCLEDLSIVDSRVLKSPTISVLLSISFLKSYIFGCSYFGCIYMFIMDISSWWVLPLIIMKCPSLSLFMVFVLKSILSKYCYPGFFFVCPFAWNLFSIPSLSVRVDLFFWGESLVDSIYTHHCYLSIQLLYVFWFELSIYLHLRLLFIGTNSLPVFLYLTLSPSLSLPFIAVSLTSFAVLVWWMYTLLTFFCLGSSLFCFPL